MQPLHDIARKLPEHRVILHIHWSRVELERDDLLFGEFCSLDNILLEEVLERPNYPVPYRHLGRCGRVSNALPLTLGSGLTPVVGHGERHARVGPPQVLALHAVPEPHLRQPNLFADAAVEFPNLPKPRHLRLTRLLPLVGLRQGEFAAREARAVTGGPRARRALPLHQGPALPDGLLLHPKHPLKLWGDPLRAPLRKLITAHVSEEVEGAVGGPALEHLCHAPENARLC
mmetsp:Transcript_23613/g.59783  ORF Transcript_23613/g.59783 Transcript_23613/m.59783 type:complete len:230 (-) Transcript_23613:95-784(-)